MFLLPNVGSGEILDTTCVSNEGFTFIGLGRYRDTTALPFSSRHFPWIYLFGYVYSRLLCIHMFYKDREHVWLPVNLTILIWALFNLFRHLPRRLSFREALEILASLFPFEGSKTFIYIYICIYVGGEASYFERKFYIFNE